MHLLDHVSIAVPDLQAARAFYDALGFTASSVRLHRAL